MEELELKPGSSQTHSNERLVLQVPHARTDFGEIAFQVSTANSWSTPQHDPILSTNTLFLMDISETLFLTTRCQNVTVSFELIIAVTLAFNCFNCLIILIILIS